MKKIILIILSVFLLSLSFGCNKNEEYIKHANNFLMDYYNPSLYDLPDCELTQASYDNALVYYNVLSKYMTEDFGNFFKNQFSEIMYNVGIVKHNCNGSTVVIKSITTSLVEMKDPTNPQVMFTVHLNVDDHEEYFAGNISMDKDGLISAVTFQYLDENYIES